MLSICATDGVWAPATPAHANKPAAAQPSAKHFRIGVSFHAKTVPRDHRQSVAAQFSKAGIIAAYDKGGSLGGVGCLLSKDGYIAAEFTCGVYQRPRIG
jgi:hypothetical protein